LTLFIRAETGRPRCDNTIPIYLTYAILDATGSGELASPDISNG
jgi:hypothetical protein